MFCVSFIKLLLDNYFVRNYDFREVVCMLMFMDTLNTPIELRAHVIRARKHFHSSFGSDVY